MTTNGGHKFHKCKEEGCYICEGGLGWCTVCGAFEGQLLTTCPGFKLSEETLDACYKGNVYDFHRIRSYIQHGARIVNGKLVWR